MNYVPYLFIISEFSHILNNLLYFPLHLFGFAEPTWRLLPSAWFFSGDARSATKQSALELRCGGEGSMWQCILSLFLSPALSLPLPSFLTVFLRIQLRKTFRVPRRRLLPWLISAKPKGKKRDEQKVSWVIEPSLGSEELAVVDWNIYVSGPSQHWRQGSLCTFWCQVMVSDTRCHKVIWMSYKRQRCHLGWQITTLRIQKWQQWMIKVAMGQ